MGWIGAEREVVGIRRGGGWDLRLVGIWFGSRDGSLPTVVRHSNLAQSSATLSLRRRTESRTAPTHRRSNLWSSSTSSLQRAGSGIANERDLGSPTSGIWDRQRAGSGIANERDLGLPTSRIWHRRRGLGSTTGSGIDDGVWDRRRAGFCTLHQSECGSRFAHPSDPMRIACAWNSPQMIIARRSTQRARCLSAQPAQFTRRTRCAC